MSIERSKKIERCAVLSRDFQFPTDVAPGINDRLFIHLVFARRATGQEPVRLSDLVTEVSSTALEKGQVLNICGQELDWGMNEDRAEFTWVIKVQNPSLVQVLRNLFDRVDGIVPIRFIHLHGGYE